jgi:hypothetical protein
MLTITVQSSKGDKIDVGEYPYDPKYDEFFRGMIADSITMWGSIGYFVTWAIR